MNRTVVFSIRFSLLAALAAITLIACDPVSSEGSGGSAGSGGSVGNGPLCGHLSGNIPDTSVYKTKANYDDKVPIELNAAKTAVSSYPGPTDVVFAGDGMLRTPTALHKSYLKDNRGIGTDSVFTSYTYTQYSQLASAPTPTELFDSIVDFDPFTELWQCPREAPEAVLNQWIDANQLAVCCKQYL